jgi:hypothetical protein
MTREHDLGALARSIDLERREAETAMSMSADWYALVEAGDPEAIDVYL